MDKEERMFALVDQYKESGQSMKVFSGLHNIKLSTFTYWVQKKRRIDESQNTGGFIPIKGPANLSASAMFEVIYPNGVRIRLPHLDIDQLRRLITIYGC